jgi:hypothetical protein
MATKNRANIGANGYREINEYTVERIVESSVKIKTLAIKSTQLSRKMSEISKILQTMPVELFELVGSDILELGEQMNDIIGAIGSAHDRKAGF